MKTPSALSNKFRAVVRMVALSACLLAAPMAAAQTAEESPSAQAQSGDSRPATLGDVKDLRREMQNLREEIQNLREEMNAQGREFRAMLSEQGRELSAKIDAQGERIQGTLDTILAALVGGLAVIIAALMGIIAVLIPRREKSPAIVGGGTSPNSGLHLSKSPESPPQPRGNVKPAVVAGIFLLVLPAVDSAVFFLLS